MAESWAGRTPTPDEWRSILEKHACWLRGAEDGERANLGGANLRGANLRSADLRSADLRSADLRGANLRGANLGGANLGGANLRGANLGGADLRSANLRSADLGGANLRSADLRSADLGGANLRSADLRSADLGGADLRSANLRSADLGGADLRSANNLALHQHLIVPEVGAFTAWKKLEGDVVAQLEIPAKAARVGGVIGRKCRAEFAVVVALFRDGKKLRKVASNRFPSMHDCEFFYQAGKTVRPDSWDPSPLVECAPGIHFFINKQEALEYQ